MRLLEEAPLWIIGLVMFASLAAAHELSAWAGRRSGPDSGAGRGFLVSSALGLLALLMGFTFGAAQSRFDQRQLLVAQEANALGTAYLRTQLLSSPWREQLGAEVYRYAEVRSRFAKFAEDPAALPASRREQGALQAEIWTTVADQVRSNPTSTMNFPLVQALNEMFDIGDLRQAAHEARVPINILRMLAVFSIATAGIVGYATADQRRILVVSMGVLVLMTMAFCVILDLDRPGTGAVTIRQAPMERAVESVRSSEQTRTNALRAPSPVRP